MPVHVLDHPLASHILTHLRDQTTKPATFRTLAYQLSLLLAIESTADIEVEEKIVRTPLESMIRTGRDPRLTITVSIPCGAFVSPSTCASSSLHNRTLGASSPKSLCTASMPYDSRTEVEDASIDTMMRRS